MKKLGKKTAAFLLVIDIIVLCGAFLLPSIGIVKFANDPPEANLTVSALCIVVLIVTFILYKRLQDKDKK